jgi:hypothetical protein
MPRNSFWHAVRENVALFANDLISPGFPEMDARRNP